MDTVNGIPALQDDDPASLIGKYSRDLRTAIAPVAGRREGVVTQDFPSGQTTITVGGFTYAEGVTQHDGGIRVPVRGFYYVAAGIRLGSSPSGEIQLRINGDASPGRLAIQSINGYRHANASTVAMLSANETVTMQIYSNAGSNTIDDLFDGLPYIAVALLYQVDN